MKKVVLGCTALLLLAVLPPAQAAPVKSLPPDLYDQLKSGKKLNKVWIHPKYDPSQGFALGHTDSKVDGLNWVETVQYLRQAMGRLEFAGSPYTLSVNVVGLDTPAIATPDRLNTGTQSGTVILEGLVTDQDGAAMLAFAAWEKCDTWESALANRRAAIDRIALALSKELGPRYQQAMEARLSAPVQAAPQPPRLALPSTEPPLDTQGRLLQLDDLKKRGLITAEEYEAHKAKILGGS